MIAFEIPVVPVPKERARVTRFGTYTPARTREFENHIRVYAQRNAPENLLILPLKLYCEFHLPKPKKPKFKEWPAVAADIDNYLKAVMDGMNRIIWKDDSLICHIEAKKLYALDKPKIVVRIELAI